MTHSIRSLSLPLIISNLSLHKKPLSIISRITLSSCPRDTPSFRALITRPHSLTFALIQNRDPLSVSLSLVISHLTLSLFLSHALSLVVSRSLSACFSCLCYLSVFYSATGPIIIQLQEKESTRESKKEGRQAREAKALRLRQETGTGEEAAGIVVTGFRGKRNIHLFMTRAHAHAMAWQYLL